MFKKLKHNLYFPKSIQDYILKYPSLYKGRGYPPMKRVICYNCGHGISVQNQNNITICEKCLSNLFKV